MKDAFFPVLHEIFTLTSKQRNNADLYLAGRKDDGIKSDLSFVM
jgi:hypothetical protein